MAGEQGRDYTTLNLGAITAFLSGGGRLTGLEAFLGTLGARAVVHALGVQRLWLGMSLEQREEFRRLARQDFPPGA
jgi:hypothetical protein